MRFPAESRSTLGFSSVEVTPLGLGTAPLAGMYDAVGDDQAARTIDAAFAAGIRFFDTAPWYGFGRGETRLGAGLRGRERGLTLSTKVGRLLVPHEHGPDDWPAWPEKLPLAPVHDYGYDAVHKSLEDSLERSGLPRFDVLFLHDIGAMTHGAEHPRHFEAAMKGGLRALTELRDAGKIGALGIGVNEIDVLLQSLDYGAWDVFLLAGRYTLLEQDAALDALLPAAKRAGTSIIVGGAFNSGLLAGGGTWNYADAPAELIKKRDALRDVCREYDVAIEAVALQFPLAHPAVASVLMGCRSPEEVEQNLAHAAATIPPELWHRLRHQGFLSHGAPTPD